MSVPNQSNATGSDSLPKQDVANDSKQDAATDSKQDAATDSKKDLATEIKQDVPTDPKEQPYQYSNQNILSAHAESQTINPDHILNRGSIGRGEDMETDDTLELIQSAFQDQSLRNTFLRNVYGILTLQLVVVLGMMLVMFYTPPVKDYVLNSPGYIIATCVIFPVLLLFVFFVKRLRWRTSWKILSLVVLTICLGYFIGAVSLDSGTEDVLKAVITSIVTVVSLIIFTFQAKIKLTLTAGAVMILTIGLLSFAILASVFRVHILYNLYAVLGSTVFSLYILADTQMIMDAAHPLKIMPEEFVFTSLNLYVDFFHLIIIIVYPRYY